MKSLTLNVCSILDKPFAVTIMSAATDMPAGKDASGCRLPFHLGEPAAAKRTAEASVAEVPDELVAEEHVAEEHAAEVPSAEVPTEPTATDPMAEVPATEAPRDRGSRRALEFTHPPLQDKVSWQGEERLAPAARSGKTGREGRGRPGFLCPVFSAETSLEGKGPGWPH